MATLIQAPESINPPSVDYTQPNVVERLRQAEAEYSNALAKHLRQRHPHNEFVGQTIRFQVADGYAVYMVANTSPAELVHLPFGDEYAIPPAHVRGLEPEDILQLARSERAFEAIFSAQGA